MQILIIGAGRIGRSVAEALVDEDNDITLVDTDSERIEEMQDRLDLRGIVGNATSPDVQATWAGDTGYFPISSGAYETDTLSKIYTEYPQLEVSANQLRNSKVHNLTAGPLCSQLPQLRTDLETALESVFNGGDVDAAIETAVNSTNSAIESANAGVA